MKRLLGHDVYVAVISAGRHENVGPMTEKIGQATWYVPDSQAALYQEHGAITRSGTAVGSNVPRVRNEMIWDAHAQGVPLVMLDDDLKWAAFARNGKAEKVPASLAIKNMVERLMETDFYLAGASPTNNAYFSTKENSTTLFVRSGIMVIKPGTDLRFDTRMPVKEDYDYSLQHITTHGGLLRCDDLLFDFQQRTNRGGHVDQRSASTEELAISRLFEKWGPLVKRHTTREHEVLLNVPRRKREVWT